GALAPNRHGVTSGALGCPPSAKRWAALSAPRNLLRDALLADHVLGQDLAALGKIERRLDAEVRIGREPFGLEQVEVVDASDGETQRGCFVVEQDGSGFGGMNT